MIQFDRRTWETDKITNLSKAAWTCGKCGSSPLALTEAIKPRKWDYDTATVKCNQSHCGQRYVLIGNKIFLEGNQQRTKGYFQNNNYGVRPTHFQPELALFSIPNSIPEEARNPLQKSFNHFWYDHDVCVQQISTAIEILISKEKKETPHPDKMNLKSNLNNFEMGISNLRALSRDMTASDRSAVLDLYEKIVSSLNLMYP